MLFALQVLMTCTFVAFGANTQAYDSGRGGRPYGVAPTIEFVEIAQIVDNSRA